MIFQSPCRSKRQSPDLLTSRPYNERAFYQALVDDLARCQREALIESPFLATRRVGVLTLAIRKMVACGVCAVVNIRHQQEYGRCLLI